jgi:hypothetical protein
MAAGAVVVFSCSALVGFALCRPFQLRCFSALTVDGEAMVDALYGGFCCVLEEPCPAEEVSFHEMLP